MTSQLLTAAITLVGLIAGIVVAGVVYHFCFDPRRGDGNGMTADMLEDIARRVRIVREGSEDIETRIARLQELRQIYERRSASDAPAHESDHHNESEGG